MIVAPGATSVCASHALSIVATRLCGSRSTVASTLLSFGVCTAFRNNRLNLSAHHPASTIGAGTGSSLGACIVVNVNR